MCRDSRDLQQAFLTVKPSFFRFSRPRYDPSVLLLRYEADSDRSDAEIGTRQL